MIVDSSALLAAILNEADEPRVAAAMIDAPVLRMSAANWVEAAIVVHSQRYPSVQIDRNELGADGALGGYIRPKKVAGHLTRFRGDGIVVTVPYERLDRITGPEPAAGGWQMTIRFTAEPEEEIT